MYAVWFANYGDDHRTRWPSDLLTDPRVLHFWDEEKRLGRHYQDRLKTDGIAWDMYVLYDAAARWADQRSVGHGRTIIATGAKLEKELDRIRHDDRSASGQRGAYRRARRNSPSLPGAP